MTHACPAIDDPNTVWPAFCPNSIPAYVFAALFGIVTIVHIVQAIVYRKFYSLVAIVSCVMQTGNFVVRLLSIKHVTNKGLYSGWFILMMAAPVWTNAYTYMVMGRMIYNFTVTGSTFKVKAWHIGQLFVLLDIIAFIVQIAGLGTVGANQNPNGGSNGIYIYLGGIGFQQLCIFLFLAFAIRFHNQLRHQQSSTNRMRGLCLLYVEYTVVALISVRIIFRLIEYWDGINSSIGRHEVYEYIFDSTLMLIALSLFNIFHPGRLMPRKESNMPGRKVRKAAKKQGNPVHGRVEEYYVPIAHDVVPLSSDIEAGR